MMATTVVLMTLFLLAASYLAFWTDRGGWFGVPLGLIVLVLMPSSVRSVWFCAGIVALCTSGLPKFDKVAASAIGLFMLFFINYQYSSGPDNPLLVIVPFFSAGLASGAMIGIIVSLLPRVAMNRTTH
jgi:hypothetical protein